MLTYSLFKTKSMLLSATSRKAQLDADLQSAQSPEHALVSNMQEKARCLQTYKLFIKFESMLLSSSEYDYKENINLHSVYNQSIF